MEPTRSLARGLRVLELVAESPSGCAFRTIARQLGLANAGVARLLGALAALGYLRRDPSDGLYRPGERFGWLGTQEDAELRLRRLAMPGLRRLHATAGCVVLLLRWTGRSMVCIERLGAVGSHRYQEIGHVTLDMAHAPWGLFVEPAPRAPEAAARTWRRREIARLLADGWARCDAADRRRIAAPLRDRAGALLGAVVAVGMPAELDHRIEAVGAAVAAAARGV